VFTLKGLTQGSKAVSYFAKDNYYTEGEALENSQWFGQGASRLGLEGVVDKDVFQGLLDGKVNGQTIGRRGGSDEASAKHRPGIDLTFSAPKSVSIVAEVLGNKRVRAAHEAAVHEALRYVESRLIETRQRRHGLDARVKTQNAIFAQFRHNTSRGVDPHTHTHSVLINATERKDGVWASIANEALFKNRPLIGAIYTSALAKELQALGFELEYKNDGHGNFEIKGFEKAALDAFSSRTKAIDAFLGKQGTARGEGPYAAIEHAAVTTKKRKGRVDGAAVIAFWKEIAAEVGISDAQREPQSKTGMGQNDVVSKRKTMTGRQALEFAAAHHFERELVNRGSDVLQTAIKHSVGKVSPKAVIDAYEKAIEAGDLIEIASGMFTGRKSLAGERWAVATMHDGKGAVDAVKSAETAQQLVVSFERKMKLKLTEGQRSAVVQTLTGNDRHIAVQGLAGTGKTAMLRAVTHITNARTPGFRGWFDQRLGRGDAPIAIYGMAPTGAAAKVLKEEIGINAETVAKFIIATQKRAKAHRGDGKSDVENQVSISRPSELWIVDEASFLSRKQLTQLQRAANELNAKILLVGDRLQLQAVEAGKPFQLLQDEGMSTVEMTQIQRQKNEGLRKAVGIMTESKLHGEGEFSQRYSLEANGAAFDELNNQGRIKEFATESFLEESATAIAARFVRNENVIAMTPFNEDRTRLNALVRGHLQHAGVLGSEQVNHSILVSRGLTRAQIKAFQSYKKGDVVRFGKTYRSIAFTKGDYAKVTSVNHNEGSVALEIVEGTRIGAAITWFPAKQNVVEVYESEKRELATGDRIRITRNELDLKNGEVGTIIDMVGRKANLKVNSQIVGLDLQANPHWDHAYVSTVHAAQGATKESAILVVNALERRGVHGDEIADRAGRVFGDRAFYVGATRATTSFEVFTNSAVEARKLITKTQEKTSAVEMLRGGR
jgi:conjugative relaxase-like TrwC/TraI family protein